MRNVLNLREEMFTGVILIQQISSFRLIFIVYNATYTEALHFKYSDTYLMCIIKHMRTVKFKSC